MNAAKIRLSQKEMELITNADWILTKNSILKKIDHFFSMLQVQQKELLEKHASGIPAEVLQSAPKLSKGENYNGLPYRMLDYPKIFNQSEVFAIRTMFWWGNFFSVTIHLTGKYKSEYEAKIINSYPLLCETKTYCSINNNQWEHHFDPSNYTLVSQLNKEQFNKIISESAFCKLAYQIPLQELDLAATELIISFKRIIDLIAD